VFESKVTHSIQSLCQNATTVYKYLYFIVAACFILIRPSSGQHSVIQGTVSEYQVLWDPILLKRCTYSLKL